MRLCPFYILAHCVFKFDTPDWKYYSENAIFQVRPECYILNHNDMIIILIAQYYKATHEAAPALLKH